MLVIVFLIVVFLDTVTTVMPFVARFYAECLIVVDIFAYFDLRSLLVHF